MASGDLLAYWSALHNEPPTTSYGTLDTRNAHPLIELDQTSAEKGRFRFRMPPAYSGGGVTAVLKFLGDGVTAGTVVLKGSFSRMTGQDCDSDSFSTAVSSAATTTSATDGVETAIEIDFTDGAQIDSVVVGDDFLFQYERDPGSDSMAADAQIVSVALLEQ